MIVIKVSTSLPCLDRITQSDLARRLTVSFKLCCPDHLFVPSDLHILFLPALVHFEGTMFLKPDTPKTELAALLHIDVSAPASAEFGSSILKNKIMLRLTKEVDDWLESFFPDKKPNASADQSTSPDVLPVIEYRQLQYGLHAVDGQVVESPYGVM